MGHRYHDYRPEPEGALGLEVGESRDPQQGSASSILPELTISWENKMATGFLPLQEW